MAAAAAASPSPALVEKEGFDSIYAWDQNEQDALKKAGSLILRADIPAPFEQTKFVKTVKMAPLAAMKMLKHAAFGVKEGEASASRMSREIMGLLIGKAEKNCTVVLDALPLNVLGEENFVSIDLSSYSNLIDAINDKRKDRLVGWYHSHPFDVDKHDNCFLSSTDVQTQHMWQSALNSYFVGIVVDPKRSAAKGRPIMRAFRSYPMSTSVPKDMAPNGNSLAKESESGKNWGPVSQRYYECAIDYTLSSAARVLTESLSRESLWMRTLSLAPCLDSDYRHGIPERISKSLDLIKRDDMFRGGSHHGGRFGDSAKKSDKKSSNIVEGFKSLAALAIEESVGLVGQIAKDVIFNKPSAQDGDIAMAVEAP